MKYIDLENWKRKEHFNFFYRADYPQFNICMDLDISNFLSFTKNNGLSFYYAMIYAVTKLVNEMEDFKYRIREGKVVLHDKIYPTFTDMNKDKNDDLFKVVIVDYTGDIFEFEKSAKEYSLQQKDYFEYDKLAGRDDVIYITCIPWVSFTHVSHTITINRDDSVPRISWGKYYRKEGKTWLPFSVQVNHALTDGFHVAKYIENLQSYLDELK